MRKLAIFAPTVGLAVLLSLAGCQQNARSPESAGGTTPSDTASSSGESVSSAPEVNLDIPGLDGSTTKISQYKGKVVLVNFWATWCQPCQTEIPWLIEFNEKYGARGLVILGVSMDDGGAKIVTPFVKNKRFTVNGKSEPISYPILLGNDAISDKFGGLLGLPTSYLYSRNGQKVKTIVGLANHADLTKAIENQL